MYLQVELYTTYALPNQLNGAVRSRNGWVPWTYGLGHQQALGALSLLTLKPDTGSTTESVAFIRTQLYTSELEKMIIFMCGNSS